MRSITVVDRPLCCSSGVCGPEPDPTLARFAGDPKWLEGQGVAVGRINPSADPEVFLAQTAVMHLADRYLNARPVDDGEDQPAGCCGSAGAETAPSDAAAAPCC